MPTLKDIITAKKWFALAIEKNKLAHFVIGLPPYAQHRPDAEGGEIPMPVLAPNAEVLYAHHAENKEAHFDTDVQNAVLQIVEEEGDSACVLLHALSFIVTHLVYEKRASASFVLDCTKILDAIKIKLAENKKKFKTEPEKKAVLEYIEFYARLLCEQYNMISIF